MDGVELISISRSPQLDTSWSCKTTDRRMQGYCILWYARLLPSFR